MSGDGSAPLDPWKPARVPDRPINQQIRELERAPVPDPNAPTIPIDIVILAELLQVEPDFILRNPRSYTPPTFGPVVGADGHLDPGKFAE